MELHDIKQGSPEWLALRQNYFTASEATAMMGDSLYMSRDQLLHQKKTGSTPEVAEHKQRQFDRGHAAEAKARPLLEKGMVGEDLFPVTGTLTVEGLPLLASFDGLTMDKTLVFEHKLWNDKLVAQIEGEGLEPTHYWQLEHQLLVSGAERVLFVSSDGTAENFRYVYYESQDHRRDALIAGWHQFKADLETFQPQAPEPVLVGELIPECMDLMAGIRGQVIQSNLAELESHIQQRIHQTKKELVSDQDFLDAESAVKFFSNTEKKLKDGKKNLLSQVPDIKKLFADIDHLAKAMANIRLPLDKKVKHWKQSRKDKMVLAAVTQLEQDRQAVNADLGVGWVPSVATAADFQEVLTNLRNPESMQSAINDRLAQARIDLKQQAAAMAKNLAVYQKLAADKDYLFPDLDILLHKDQLDLMAIIEMRINQESRQNAPANEPVPAPEPAPTQEEQQDLLYAPEEQKELILASTVKAVEQIVGTFVMDNFRYDCHGNEYAVQVVIRRTELLVPATKLKLKEALA